MKNKSKKLLIMSIMINKILRFTTKYIFFKKLNLLIEKGIDNMWYPIVKDYYLKGFYTEANLLVFVTAEMITEEQMLEMIEEKKQKEEVNKKEELEEAEEKIVKEVEEKEDLEEE